MSEENVAVVLRNIETFEHDEEAWLSTADPLFNVGDDTTRITRLRRVWDSWSTDYTNAYASGKDANPASATFGFPM